MTEVDVTNLSDRRRYYRDRKDFLTWLLSSDLTPRQRRDADIEMQRVCIKLLVLESRDTPPSEPS
jgi:hypothetical protein